MHLIPVDSSMRLPATALDSLPRRLAELGREHEMFAAGEALDLDTQPDQATAAAEGRGDEPTSGIRVRRDGAVAVWSALDQDGLGHILDPEDVENRLAQALRLCAEAIPSEIEQVAPAVALAPISFVTEGKLADLGRRTSATIGMPSEEWVRVNPEDSFTTTGLKNAADEVSRELGARLLQRFRAVQR
jgi:hypothetical protein